MRVAVAGWAVLLAGALRAGPADPSRVYTNADLERAAETDVRVYTNADLEELEPLPVQTDYVDPFAGLGWGFVYDVLRYEREKLELLREFELKQAEIAERARERERLSERRWVGFYPGFLRVGYGNNPGHRPRRPDRADRPGETGPVTERHWRFLPPNPPLVRDHLSPARPTRPALGRPH